MPPRRPQRLPPRASPRSLDRSATCRTRCLAGRAGGRHGHPLPEIQDNKPEHAAEPALSCLAQVSALVSTDAVASTTPAPDPEGIQYMTRRCCPIRGNASTRHIYRGRGNRRQPHHVARPAARPGPRPPARPRPMLVQIIAALTTLVRPLLPAGLGLVPRALAHRRADGTVGLPSR